MNAEEKEHRAKECYRLYVEEGLTLQAIGNLYGCTRERVRQILNLQGITGKEIRARFKAEKEAQALAERIARAKPCEVCGELVMHNYPNKRTCGPECSDLLRSVRFRLDEQAHYRHRINQAKSILRHRDKKAPNKVAWAERMLSEHPPLPNRRYTQKGSVTEWKFQRYLDKRNGRL